MTREELKAYLAAQIQEIEKYKWIESERRRQDIGFHAAALEWIGLYSESFRNYWQNIDANSQTHSMIPDKIRR